MGRKISDETKQRLREINLGKHHTEETKKKVGESRKYIVYTDEWKKKISQANRGRIFSKEHGEKISKALTGKLLSDEHKRSISVAHMKNIDNNLILSMYNNGKSPIEIGKLVGVSFNTIYRRLKKIGVDTSKRNTYFYYPDLKSRRKFKKD